MEVSRIENLIRPVVEGSGYELYDIELGGRILKIFIDKQGGVSLTDCVDVTKLLGPILDVEDVVPGGQYSLEVSSPGLERVLRKPQHYAAVVGKRLSVRTIGPLSQWNGADKFYEARKKITGDLKSFDGSTIVVLADGREAKIPIQSIQKAQVVFEVEVGQKKGNKPHGR